jgi:hypothetical protein
LALLRRRRASSPRILAQSAVAVSHTGDTNETTLATVTIPAGAMRANGSVEIISQWSGTASANNKTRKVKFGATVYHGVAATTSPLVRVFTRIMNRGAANSQVGPNNNDANGWTASAGSLQTSAVDTTAAVSITFTGQLASAGETITLENYVVKLYPRS